MTVDECMDKLIINKKYTDILIQYYTVTSMLVRKDFPED